MAELRIQPKKSAPSPWLLVGLAALLLAAAAYFYLRPDPAAAPAAPVPAAAPLPAPADTLAAARRPPGARPAPDSLPKSPVNDPASPYNASGLAALATDLLALADRADLRDDANIREQRDNFTSAINRLPESGGGGDARASLRPGLLAAAGLLLAVQKKAYPDLAAQAADLLRQAGEQTGRYATPADQTQTRAWVSKAADLERTMSPAADGPI